MGLVTIPMALLTLASALVWLVFLAAGHGDAATAVPIAFASAMVLAYASEMLTVLLDQATHAARGRAIRGVVAVLSGAVPMIVVLAWCHACFARFGGDHGSPAAWLLSYGLATGPWTLFAALVGKERRTLAAIRAYAAHLAYWLMSALFLLGAPSPLAVAAMALPAILPATVGTLLAAADRAALRNVRV